MRIRLPIVAMLPLAIGVSPAFASTLPSLPGAKPVSTIQGGALDAAADWPIAPHLTAGVAAMHVGSEIAAAVRATGLLWTGGPDLAVGWTMSVGASQTTGLGVRVPFGAAVPIESSVWAQPALNVAVPCLFGTRLRATVGPSLGLADSLVNADPRYLWTAPSGTGGWVVRVIPSVELAVPLGERLELTFGGNGLVGARGTY